eukprot:TRINITY_DN4942_c0_g1_i1.p1 TRINITY_DN4942_c0_g1~~TRINITY_DN4942_c0_g1_i1.p1  ORF type:complete len:281 (-),score=82.93 TRINITY_DN4942_c0_g1_i1:82-924(-)
MNLPEDILIEIFKSLNPDELNVIGAVCKTFYRLTWHYSIAHDSSRKLKKDGKFRFSSKRNADLLPKDFDWEAWENPEKFQLEDSLQVEPVKMSVGVISASMNRKESETLRFVEKIQEKNKIPNSSVYMSKYNALRIYRSLGFGGKIWKLDMESKSERGVFFLNRSEFFLMFDVTSPFEFSMLDSMVEEIYRASRQGVVPIILIGINCDLASERQVSYFQAEEWADARGFPYLELESSMEGADTVLAVGCHHMLKSRQTKKDETEVTNPPKKKKEKKCLVM